MRNKDNKRMISNIQELLINDEIGKEIIEDHEAFKAIIVSIFNEKILKQDIK